MDKYNLTKKEDLRLRSSIMLPGKRRSLYEYLCQLPLEDLQAYPEKGYRWWFGRAARTAQALAMRDYILHWHFASRNFRQQYPREYLETLSTDDLRLFVDTYIRKTPIWAYEEPIKDALQILFQQANPCCADEICDIW